MIGNRDNVAVCIACKSKNSERLFPTSFALSQGKETISGKEVHENSCDLCEPNIVDHCSFEGCDTGMMLNNTNMIVRRSKFKNCRRNIDAQNCKLSIDGLNIE
jgi:hypothetical protein